MIFAPFRYFMTGIFVGIVLMGLSNDYVIISRRKYDKLKEKVHKNE